MNGPIKEKTTKIKASTLKQALIWAREFPESYEKLGVSTDAEIAEELNLKPSRITRYRRALGITYLPGRQGEGRSRALRGTSMDLSLIEIPEPSAKEKRVAAKNRLEIRYPGIFKYLGKIQDSRLAEKYGIQRETVRVIRGKFNIPSFSERSSIFIDLIPSLKLTKPVAESMIILYEFIEQNMETIVEIRDSEQGEE